MTSGEPKADNDQVELPLNSEEGQLEPAPDSATDDSGESLEWTVHPVKRRPVVSIIVSAFIFLCGLITYYSTGMSWFAGLAMVIMFASLAKFYFPTHYHLDSSGVTIKTTTQTLKKEWSLYRSFYRDRNGVLLSTFAAPSRLENFRGLYVIFEGNGDLVTNFVRRFVEEYSDDLPAPGKTSL